MATAQQQLREWIRGQIEGKEGLHISDLADEAMAYLRQKPELLEEFVQSRVRPLVYHEAQAVVAETRSIHGDWAPTVKEYRHKRIEFKSRFRGFMQETASGHRDVMKMTRIELRQAGDIRLQAGRRETVLGRTFHELANRMTSDVQVVEDAFTDQQLEELYEKVGGEVNEA